MGAKFTPGPWYVRTDSVTPNIWVKGGGWIANVPTYGAMFHHTPDRATQAANAALIASAPMMFEALELAPVPSKYHGHHGFEVDRFLADYEDWMAKRRAALSSALLSTGGE